MRKAILIAIIALVLGAAPLAALGAPPQAQRTADEALFREAKLLVFDKDWKAALDKIDELREKYPYSPWSGQALFYKGECLNSLGGRQREALRTYKEFIGLPGAPQNLIEEAEGRIIDIAFDLYQDGDASALREIEDRLDVPNKVVSYYAAYKLSFVSDKRIAVKAAPVLKKIVETETDPELLDRARIALLRASPESLKSAEESQPRAKTTARTLHISIRAAGQKEPAFSLNIPFALADLALNALDEDNKAAMRKKGYDLNKIFSELAKTKILRIAGEDGSLIEIWID
jgi:Tetratricopeptide repeat